MTEIKTRYAEFPFQASPKNRKKVYIKLMKIRMCKSYPQFPQSYPQPLVWFAQKNKAFSTFPLEHPQRFCTICTVFFVNIKNYANFCQEHSEGFTRIISIIFSRNCLSLGIKKLWRLTPVPLYVPQDIHNNPGMQSWHRYLRTVRAVVYIIQFQRFGTAFETQREYAHWPLHRQQQLVFDSQSL